MPLPDLPPATRRPTRSELHLLGIGLVALLSTALLWWSNQLWWDSYSTYVPATDNLRQARQNATRAFLLQGKLFAGESVDRQEIAALLDSAAMNVRDIMTGHSTLQGVEAEPPDAALLADAREYQLALGEFDLISRRLLENLGNPDILRIRQRNAFQTTEQVAHQLESRLVQAMSHSIAQQQRDQRLGLALWLAFMTGLFLMMWRAARVEAALTRQQRLMETVVQSATDAIFVKDLQGRYQLFNEGAARLVGKPAREVLGQTDTAIFTPEAAAQVMQIDREVLKAGVVQNHEERLTTADGIEKVFLVTKGPLTDEDGTPTGIFGISREVTEHKRAEEALAASEASLRTYIQDAPIAIWLTDPEGRCVDSNPEGLRMLGYPAETLRQKRLADLAPAGEREAVRRHFAQLMQGGRYADDLCLERADGQSVWIRLKAVRIAPDRCMAYGWNITERREKDLELEAYRQRLEERVAERTAELAAAEAHARLLLESTADGLYGIDTEGRITFINPAACKLLGYEPEALMGKPIRGLIHCRQVDGTPYTRHDCPLEVTLREGRAMTVDNEVYWHADGHTIPVLYATHPMWRDGHIVGAVVSFMDVTERRNLETAREAARQEAERLARVRSEFLANMSHEIRTPLNGVLGLARMGYRDSPDSGSRTTFARILDAGRLLLGIVNDILDFSKIEAGKLQVESIPMDLHRLLDETLDMLAESARAKRITLSLEKSADLPRACLGDPLRLGQILANLLSNGVKFTERGGVSLDVSLRDGELEFRVRDTGIGMSQAQIAGLFTPFAQGDGSTTRKFGGTGLGLTITQRLVELLGGRLQVDSHPGAGSCFTVLLPYRPAALPESPSDSQTDSPPTSLPDQPAGAGTRLEGLAILVAEDNEINQLIMEDLLGAEGARVTLAGDGQEALDLVQGRGPAAFDAVLMDVQMPVMDGYEATRRILALAPALPIIGQTAHAMTEERDKCLAAGMQALVTKPVNGEELVQTLRRCLPG